LRRFMIETPKVAAYISLPELGEPKPTLRDVVRIAKTINRDAGLIVLAQMNLFLGAAAIKQDLEKDRDAKWKAQGHLIRTTVADRRLKILKAKLFKALSPGPAQGEAPTVDVYGHLVPGANRAAVDRLDAIRARNQGATESENTDPRVEAK